MDNPTLQIVEYDTKRAMVTDVWESADHKLLLKCIKSRVMGKLPWSTGFGEEYTYTVYEVIQGDGSSLGRKWELKIEAPKGCKNVRPCIDGVDFLIWNPPAV